MTFDRVGRLLYSANAGLVWHGVQGGYYEKNFGKHGPLHNLYTYGHFRHVEHQGQTGRPNTGATIYLGDSFPERFRDAFLCGDFLSHTCSWWTMQPAGSTVTARLGGLLLDSHDTWFGATDLCLGPQGEIYLSDFCDQRTAHPDPDAKWDTSNGRIYRIQAAGHAGKRPLELPSRTSAELLPLLKSSNDWQVQRVRRILAERHEASLWPDLAELARQTDSADIALQGLWALHGSGGLDAELAALLMQHPSEHVRAWTVRLLGDRRQIGAHLARRMAELAATDSSVQVRAQLAATAKRLPGAQALPIALGLLDLNADAGDPFVPLLIWWALEDKALEQRAALVAEFSKPASWLNGMKRANAFRLLRRYAAAGTTDGYEACTDLVDSVPLAYRDEAWRSLGQGLTERSRGFTEVSSAGLYDNVAEVTAAPAAHQALEFAPVTATLRERILAAWKERGDLVRTRLALEARIEEPYQKLLHDMRHAPTKNQLVDWLAALNDYGDEECVPVVLDVLIAEQPDTVLAAALKVLEKFTSDRITSVVLSRYTSLNGGLQSRARDLLFSRPGSAMAFLKRVEDRTIAAEQVPLEQLRRLALFKNSEIDGLVRRHWGNIQPGTPEEKLADMRRFSNDLRAGTGDSTRGRGLFTKHCANCHKLRGEGTVLGPDLTSTVSGDPVSLLANIVDPSAVVKRDYINYVVVTKTGGVHTGLIAEQDAASITLVDAKNQRTRLNRDQIEDLGESPNSLMPEKLLEQLTPQELRDLFAFLRGP
ncbi:MAG: c-type cytochrome [Planctomycetes bacterium]|nr:c-type cytochrome [Planctomycetota bacterium]